MVDMMTALALIALAAGWRLWDGRNHDGQWSRHTAVRNAIGVLIALAAAYAGAADSGPYGLGLLSPWPLWLAAVASLSLIMGYTDWLNTGYMMVRYGGPAAVAVSPCVYFGAVVWYAAAGYVLACMLAGVSYSAFHAVRHRLPLWHAVGIDGWQAYGSLVTGAVIMGGLSLL